MGEIWFTGPKNVHECCGFCASVFKQAVIEASKDAIAEAQRSAGDVTIDMTQVALANNIRFPEPAVVTAPSPLFRDPQTGIVPVMGACWSHVPGIQQQSPLQAAAAGLLPSGMPVPEVGRRR